MFRALVIFRFISTDKSYSSISKLYLELPYIVYKNKYLIPQKPARPLTKYFLFRKQFMENKKQEAPLGPVLVKIYSELPQNEKKVLEQKQVKNVKEYRKARLEYKQKYLDPLRIKSINGLNVFRSQFIKKHANSETKITMKSVASEWNKLGEKEKEAFKVLAEQQKSSKIHQLEEYIEKHQIPYLKVYRSVAMYVQQAKSNTSEKDFNSQLFAGYRYANEKQKQHYKKAAAQKTLESKNHHQNFLKRWNLTQQSLGYILSICNQLKEIRKARRLESQQLKKLGHGGTSNSKQQLNSPTQV